MQFVSLMRPVFAEIRSVCNSAQAELNIYENKETLPRQDSSCPHWYFYVLQLGKILAALMHGNNKSGSLDNFMQWKIKWHTGSGVFFSWCVLEINKGTGSNRMNVTATRNMKPTETLREVIPLAFDWHVFAR